MSGDARNAGYDDWLDAIADDDGYYVKCENSHGSLPPRRACPQCGTQVLTDEPLPETGEIETYTVVRVGTPDFSEDAPYATAVAAFGGVRLTGQVRGVEFDEIEPGLEVVATVGRTETTGERVLVFEPR